VPPETAPARFGELDALRGIAVILVLLFHYTWRSEQVLPAAHGFSRGLAWGHYGVELFFAISGFVILMTLRRTATTMDFAVSRFARLFPAYWAGIVLTTGIVSLLGAGDLAQPASVIAVNISMLQSFLYVPAVDGAYWSLGVELAFYACMWGLWRLRLLDRIETVLLGWISLKFIWWFAPALPSRLSLLVIEDYVPWFAIGMAAYRVHVGERRWTQQAAVLILGLLSVTITDTAEAAGIYLATLAIFVLAVSGRLRWLANGPLRWLGGLSYTIYLVHQNVGYAVIAWLERLGAAPALALPCAVATTLVLAELIHRLVERPSLAAIRSWWNTRRAVDYAIPSGGAG
jgi:peptidoglycan/LPS O-acetylase OafA/YrhL